MAYAHQPTHLRAFVAPQKFGCLVHFTLVANGAVVGVDENVALPEGFQQLRKPGDARFLAFSKCKADDALAALVELGWMAETTEAPSTKVVERAPAPRPDFPQRPQPSAHVLGAKGLTGTSPWDWIRTATLAARAHLTGAEVTSPDADLARATIADGVLHVSLGGKPMLSSLVGAANANGVAEDTLVDVWALALLAPTTGLVPSIGPQGLTLSNLGRDVAVLERRLDGWVGTIGGQRWNRPLTCYRAVLRACATRRVQHNTVYAVRCAKTGAFFQGWDGQVARFGPQPHTTGLHKRLDRCTAFVDAHSAQPTSQQATPDTAWADLPRMGNPTATRFGRAVEIVALDRVSGSVSVVQDATTTRERAALRAALVEGLDSRLGTAACAAVHATFAAGRTDLTTLVAVRPAPGCPKATSGVARLPVKAALRAAGIAPDDCIGVQTTLQAFGAEMWSIAMATDDVDTLLQALPPHSVVAVAPMPSV
jgi:hypothetical protein